MSVILDIIDEKNNQLLGFDAKKKERDTLVEKLAILDKEINEFDKSKVVADIEELTDCAIKLGLITVEAEDVEEAENTEVDIQEI